MSNLPTLRLVYDDLVRERDRLRDARRAVTSQLGPIPAVSAVVIALFGTLSDNISDSYSTLLFKVAIGAFILMVVISTIAVFRQPYRKLREKALGELPGGGQSLDGESEIDWLSTMIRLERKLTEGLERAFEWERGLLLVVQLLFVAQIVLLGLITVSASMN
jgi:hypothetical protein